MERASVQKGIRESWAAAVELNLGETIGSGSALGVDRRFRDLLFSSDAHYNEIYLAGLELRHFNILLTDYSFFQYSVTGERSVRFAYYPNPFLSVVNWELDIDRLRELEEAELITHEEFLVLVDERRSDNRAAPIRYENAPQDRKPFSHPTSHFHIGHGVAGRWALARRLTPLAFTLLVLKHYFPAHWIGAGEGETESEGRWGRKLIRARQRCSELTEEEFSNRGKGVVLFSVSPSWARAASESRKSGRRNLRVRDRRRS